MLDSIWVIAPVSVVLGFLSGMGTGGGSLLILWLTMGLGMEPSMARSINLLFFIPSALVACLFRWKQGAFHFEKIWPALAAGCLSAGVFSLLSQNLELDFLKKLFGLLLIYTGIRELKWKRK